MGQNIADAYSFYIDKEDAWTLVPEQLHWLGGILIFL